MVPQHHWDIQITRADRAPTTHSDIQMTPPNVALPLLWDIQIAASIRGACASQLDRSLGQRHLIQEDINRITNK